ncbi:hypothetical protein B296_00017114 [Ensete ventricosum]|uniref:Uncharacterized protein n=1 Tax=Ensete ventricosum TaxID=4639 RepID=A0A426ZR80_ENSVE|nr:hypothetical protein B296_00017114 [Ensete ventricosum]
MQPHRGDDMDDMAEDYDMGDVEDDMYEEFQGRGLGDSDSDDEEYGPLNGRATDISSAQARKGKDIQGIPWSTLSITRERYRQTRLEQYKNYENVPNSGEASEKACSFDELIA